MEIPQILKFHDSPWAFSIRFSPFAIVFGQNRSETSNVPRPSGGVRKFRRRLQGVPQKACPKMQSLFNTSQHLLLFTLSYRYRSLAGQCTRALRLDLLLLVAHHMMSLGGSSHICDEEDAKDVHPAMGALTR